MKLSDEVRSTHGQDGAIVLHIREGQMFRLNLVGSRILELLRSEQSESQIADVISREFSADHATVERDVQEFLAHLRTHHLIEVRTPETHAGS
ncbi:MAG TPA: PqqD family protein [Candidatus Acidoferrum sp.]|nr:PqqD family protein [Candidatus Acidoferrum sp.]